MSSSASKTQKKTPVTTPQLKQSEVPKPQTATNIKEPIKQASGSKNKTTPIKTHHDILKSIQHEYEQFELNMDERD